MPKRTRGSKPARWAMIMPKTITTPTQMRVAKSMVRTTGKANQRGNTLRISGQVGLLQNSLCPLFATFLECSPLGLLHYSIWKDITTTSNTNSSTFRLRNLAFRAEKRVGNFGFVGEGLSRSHSILYLPRVFILLTHYKEHMQAHLHL